MRIAYSDESGDDGYPEFSSPLFVLSTLYLHHLGWREAFERIVQFRRQLKADFGFPIKLELHTKHFLLDKWPYNELGIPLPDRMAILSLFCRLVAGLDIKIINAVIVKPRVRRPDYDVLDTALTYSVQRIENDLNLAANPSERFLMITDPGRIGKMRRTTRRIQRINFIPSKLAPGAYRKEIKAMIEDPLPKDSRESYFIQLVDLVAYVVYLYAGQVTKVADLPARTRDFLRIETLRSWLDDLKPVFNLKAAPTDEYGIVYHPK